jgi:hypothetical protein
MFDVNVGAYISPGAARLVLGLPDDGQQRFQHRRVLQHTSNSSRCTSAYSQQKAVAILCVLALLPPITN